MRFAVNLANYGDFGDPRLLADLAQDAEQAGWDGFFIWDHIATDTPMPVADPWITLAAIASRTQHIKLGTMVTPLPRRRPWKVARETASLDLLAQGRLILGVGIGTDHAREYSAFAESAEPVRHAALLDEALSVLTGLWTGEPFTFHGAHYTVDAAHFLPTPLQKPRIPIWVAAVWPHKRPLRRAANWDGVVPLADERDLTPDELREVAAYICGERRSGERGAPFDVVHTGQLYDLTPEQRAPMLSAYAAAGATWWQEGVAHTGVEEARARIRQGPPVARSQ